MFEIDPRWNETNFTRQGKFGGDNEAIIDEERILHSFGSYEERVVRGIRFRLN